MPVYTDSEWGYEFQTLTDPTPPSGSNSEWGTQYVILGHPDTAADSVWGYQPVTLGVPHHPAVILVGGVKRWVPVRSLVDDELV